MKRFQRTVEDFTCAHCQVVINGNGYTNHCSACLWSKHVDINPGDRAATCQGLMEPVEVQQQENEYILVHRCTKCGYQKRNRTAPEDSFTALIAIASGTQKR